jgi:hypothetical protein
MARVSGFYGLKKTVVPQNIDFEFIESKNIDANFIELPTLSNGEKVENL